MTDVFVEEEKFKAASGMIIDDEVVMFVVVANMVNVTKVFSLGTATETKAKAGDKALAGDIPAAPEVTKTVNNSDVEAVGMAIVARARAGESATEDVLPAAAERHLCWE